MKVSKEYLQQIIKEEVELMIQEGELDEAGGAFLKSLGKQFGAAASKGLKSAGSAIGAGAKTVGGKIATGARAVGQKATDIKTAGQQAIKTASQASAREDLGPTAQKAEKSVYLAIQTLENLSNRMKKLGMEEEAGKIDNAITDLDMVSATISKLNPQQTSAEQAPAEAEEEYEG